MVGWSEVGEAAVTGYRVYYGPAPGSHANIQWVAAPTTEATLSGLPDCAVQYVTVRASNGSQESVQDSDPVVGYPRPVVSQVMPGVIRQGETKAFAVTGLNFDAGTTNDPARPPARVQLSHPALTVRSVEVRGCGVLVVTIEAAPDAPAGFSTLFVENPDLTYGDPENHPWVFGELAQAIEIQPADAPPGATPSPGRRFDFGPASTAAQRGFQRDAGLPFDPLQRSGWLLSQGDQLETRDEVCPGVEQERRSVVFSDTPRTWEAELANGDYDVAVSVGDCVSPGGPQRVVVEGVTLIDDLQTRAGQFEIRTGRVPLRDGRLSLQIGGGGGFTTLNYVDIEPASVQPRRLESINFQPAGVTPPPGFTVDDGGAFYSLTGRGWRSPVYTRDRQRTRDPLLDTFVYAFGAGAVYEAPLRSGLYDITVAIGDADYSQGPQRVIVNGETAFDGETTGPGQFLRRTVRAHVNDDRLQVALAGRPEATNSTLDFLTVEGPPRSWRVNFQPPDEPAPAEYEPDSGQLYDDARGYGWLAAQVNATRRRSRDSEPRRDTLVFVGAAAQTWEAAVPAGDYEVTVSVGDPVYAQGPHRVIVEDVEALASERTAAGEFLERAVKVAVRDGRLTLTVGGGESGFTTINYVLVAPVMHRRAINFQPPDSLTPPGFEPDSGQVYNPAVGYGWSDDRLFSSGAFRERRIVADKALDTLVFVGAPSARWRIDVPPGDYIVTVVVGDPLYAQGPHSVSVQGAAVIDSETTAAGAFVRRSVCVSAPDGVLEVEIGGSASFFTTLDYLTLDTADCSPP